MVIPMPQLRSQPESVQHTDQTPHLDWYTTKVWPDGTQSIHIRPTTASTPNQTITLTHPDSQLLMRTLDEIAQDQTIPWSEARQAVLRGFWNALSAR